MIPKQITVGTTTYTIEHRNGLIDGKYQGECDYASQTITLVKGYKMPLPNGNVMAVRYGHKERHNTFWHELTHAILYDMGHNLHDNEHFVTAFADRLSNAIDSAKLG